MKKMQNARKFHVRSKNGKRGALDGMARLCSSVYVHAFYAIRKASDTLHKDPKNENALRDIKEAEDFLYSTNPFSKYLESVGHELHIKKGIEAMKHGSRELLFGKTGTSGRHTDSSKINEVRKNNGIRRKSK